MAQKTPEQQPGSEALNRYIEQTLLIRELSSPSVIGMADADDYRSHLIRNFTRIGDLARSNVSILEKYYYPQINAASSLEEDEVENMYLFSDAMINASVWSYLDIPLVYEQAERLLRDAERSGSDRDLIFALDGMITASYAMTIITERLYPVNQACLKYQQAGLSAGERLLSYLEHDLFRKLDDECKELILVNARYIRVVSEINGVPGGPEMNRKNLGRMLDALALADDPFYRGQLPYYNWDYHIFRTLEYIAAFTEQNNIQGFDAGQLRVINKYTKRLYEVYNSDEPYYRSIHNSKMLEICVCRNAYLAGEIDIDTYKRELERAYRAQVMSDADCTSLAVLYAPLEYILVVNKDSLSDEDIRFLDDFYSHAIEFMHKTPKKDSLLFLLSAVTLILKYFIEIPGRLDFEGMCLSMIAAIHPPTYIHTRSVADFACCLTRHLYSRNPGLFAKLPVLDGVTDGAARENALLDYVFHAALCHDVGKLMIAEAILTYGRNLLDSEFDLVHTHPAVGAYLLNRFPSTAQYADVAHGHHRWYNGRGGYPDDFDMAASPYSAVIAIVTCADCLDAATDAVGRSYKEGKTLDLFLSELHEGCGTRYAPYLAELLEDPGVRAEIELLLASGRDENYRRAFHILKQHQSDL